MILALLACNPEETAVPEDRVPAPLDDARLARRLSLDLRGVLPTLDELDRVAADPAEVDALRDEWLLDPRHEDRLVELYAERWHTRIDEYQVGPSDFGVPDDLAFEYLESIGDEPLHLMARVAAEDLPWTEVVTADWTMANPLLASMWPVELTGGGEGWQRARYTDGRPAGGVLAANGLWFRYVTNTSNKNRSRVAAIERLLLCHDVLARPVSFDGAVSLADEDATATAIRTQPTCLACHATVEPLAASLFGFWNLIEYNAYEMSHYHPERELLAESELGVSPGYFGQPLGGFVDLGPAIADDPRFWRCAVESHAEALWRRDVHAVDDFERISELEDAFLGSGLSPRTLIAAITDTPEYRSGDDWRMLSAGQLASAVADLTGFRWEYQGYELLDDDNVGFRVLAGGVDGYYVGDPLAEPAVTWVLATGRLAEGAADHAVRGPGAIDGVAFDVPPDDAAFTALHRRMYGARPDDAWLDAIGALWAEVDAAEGPAAAWAAVITAMLRDPAFLGY